MKAIVVNQCTVCYPNKEPILRNFSCTIEENTMNWIQGSSGIGKSTFFHALTGCIPKHIKAKITGEIKLFGKSLHDYSHQEQVRMIGLVFQQPHWQFATTTVSEEIAFGLGSLNVESATMRKLVDVELENCQISHLRHARLNQLSLGQQQLVALASVLVLRPKILCLDESLSAIDELSRNHLISYIHALSRDMTVCIVDHNVSNQWAVHRYISLKESL